MEGLYQKRLKKARIIVSILQIIPFARMIALTGSMARGEITASSDIDLFIIIKSGRIWTSRFFVVFILKLLGQYRTDQDVAGKVCPNRFQTDNSLKIYPQNLYHTQEYSQIMPLFDQGVYRKFMRANRWTKKRRIKSIETKATQAWVRTMGEWILSGRLGNSLELKLKTYQTKRIMWDKRTYQKNARIIISDKMLCFHPESR